MAEQVLRKGPREIKIGYAPAASSAMPYVKGDHVQVAILGDEVAITFHQFKYQEFVDAGSDQEVPTAIVARVVMRLDAFTRLVEAGGRVVNARNNSEPQE